jgi:hypothetical protein
MFFLRLLPLICCLGLLATSAFAAKPAPIPTGTGTLTGKVTIAGTRTAIVGATITAVGSAGTYSAVTNSKGSYTLAPLAGGYTVTAAAGGYAGQSFSVTIKAGTTTVQNFALSTAVVTNGVLSGTVTNAATGTALAGAVVAADHGGYSAVTGSDGKYTLTVAAGSYALTASAADFVAATQTAAVVAGGTTTTNFALAPVAEALAISSLTATPDAFVEAATAVITLSAVVEGSPSLFDWSQLSGPKVPLAALSATSAGADVSALEVATEAELVFQLTVGDGTATVSKTVTVAVQPADMVQYPAANVQIGGAATAVARFQYAGAEWCLFNVGTALKATPVALTAGTAYEVILPAFANDIEILSYAGGLYALIAAGEAGVVVVDIANPAQMSIVNVLPINFLMENVTFTETGGAILYGNTFASSASPIASLVSDGVDLYIANHEFGIHKTALANVFGDVREADGTLKIDREACTVQYAGEHGWGGPVDLLLYGGKLFAGLGAQGMGIFDPTTLAQVGRYNLYTDEARTEDYFGAMAVTQAVAADPVNGDLFVDDFTGMPDYRQVSYELTVIMRGTGTGEPTPWADMERNGKWYYEAIDVDVAQQNGRTIAYIAYALGGVVAVDVTDFESATAANFFNAAYLGYFPAVPSNGPYTTLSDPSSLLPYEGAGMLKEAGVTGVEVLGDRVYLTDHFAGLVILNSAASPEAWLGSGYNNDTDGIPNNNVPAYEDITSYNMSPWDPADNESLPWAYYMNPCELATRELKGHGYTLTLMDAPNVTSIGQVDVLECSSGGGFVMVDVTNISAPLMADRFAISVYFPSTDEIGAAADGSATQAIAIGHTDGISATADHIYVSDGPHGVSAWKITDAAGYPTDAVHLVANTLQDEYPELVGGELIYPASHTVRNIIDPSGRSAWALCVGNGLRRVPISGVEAGLGQVGAPLLIKLHLEDSFEHNGDWGVVKAFNYQDQAYDVEFVGNFAFVADGSNGLTVYDVSRDPTRASSGFFVGNIGYNQGRPLLGTASGVELWTAPDQKRYAVIATGPKGVGVVDVTDVNAMRIVKVFEPIKYENDELGSADGQAVDVEVIGDKAYFTYDSFGVLCYAMSDLVAPVPDGVDPTELFKKALDGTIIYDQRPAFLGRFKLQWVPGYEDVSGGAVKMAYTEVGGKLMQYVAFGEAGLVKIDYTDPANPLFVELKNTAAECVGAAIANGRLYVADHGGGLVLFK